MRLDLGLSGYCFSTVEFIVTVSGDEICGVAGLLGLAEYRGDPADLFGAPNFAAVTRDFDDFRKRAR